MKKIFVVICTMLLFIGTTSLTGPEMKAATNTNSSFDEIYAEAQKHLGKPYQLGGDGPNVFDCSGYTKYVINKVTGINIPRTSSQQYSASDIISKENVKKGDLVFFNYGSGIAHVGIYIGDGKMIDAQDNGVKIDNIYGSGWGEYLVGFGRIINLKDKLGSETYYTLDDTSIRSQKNWDSSVVTTIARGAKVVIDLDSAQGDNDWYKVTYGAKTGYMPIKYFSVNPVIKVAYAKDITNLRKLDSWDSTVSIEVPKGARVVIQLQTNSGDWYKVEYNGAIGYMPLKYFSDSEVVKTYYAPNAVNLRSTASWNSTVVTTVPLGYAAQVDIQSHQGDWYKVTFQGKTGWIPIQYLTAERFFDSYKADDIINFRAERRWDSDVVGTCAKGVTVSVVKNSNINGWVEIMYQGTRGYIPVQYLTEI
ncbi:SH3 domain-containing protein [Listeria booriae]|nr:SH3 domain-containing protein [Listeria booriae]